MSAFVHLRVLHFKGLCSLPLSTLMTFLHYPLMCITFDENSVVCLNLFLMCPCSSNSLQRFCIFDVQQFEWSRFKYEVFLELFGLILWHFSCLLVSEFPESGIFRCLWKILGQCGFMHLSCPALSLLFPRVQLHTVLTCGMLPFSPWSHSFLSLSFSLVDLHWFTIIPLALSLRASCLLSACNHGHRFSSPHFCRLFSHSFQLFADSSYSFVCPVHLSHKGI